MDQQSREQAFMSALVTEHFVLQSSAAATISESASRCSIYLLSLSSSLVALGFVGTTGVGVTVFAAVVLPTVFLLGWFTVVRLVDVSIENVVMLRGIARIRRHYAGLLPEAEQFFGQPEDDATTARRMTGTANSNRGALLFTMASMIGTVNSVLGGVVVALLLEAGLGTGRVPAVTVGIAAGLALLGAVYAYQQRRFARALAPGTAPVTPATPAPAHDAV